MKRRLFKYKSAMLEEVVKLPLALVWLWPKAIDYNEESAQYDWLRSGFSSG